MVMIQLDFVHGAKGAIADALVSGEWKNGSFVERFVDCTAMKGMCGELPLFLMEILGIREWELLSKDIKAERKSLIVKLTFFNEFGSEGSLIGQYKNSKDLYSVCKDTLYYLV